MNGVRLPFILLFLVGSISFAGPLEDGFRSPPSSAKPRTWWHWMDGNVTKKGITADLEAMAKAGFGGATIVDVNCSLPRGALEFDTPEWYDTVKFAVTEAHRLGLEIDLPNCSGWSSSGGPWITPERSMKFVEFTETRVRGGERFRGKLPIPRETHGFYEDVAVLAFPIPKAEGGRLLPLAMGVRRMNERQAVSNVVAFGSPRPFRASGISFRILGGKQWNEPGKIRIETPDASGWKVAAELDFDMRRTGVTDRAVRFYPFAAPVESSLFRVVFSFPPDPTSPGYVAGYDPTFEVSEIALETKMCLSDLNAKSFRVRKPIRPDVASATPDQVVPKGTILDLTSRLAADGTLDWTAPAGRTWAILRIGYASNGETNHPASGRGSGLECDKLDASALDLHFDAYLAKMCAFLGKDLVGRGKNGFGGVLVDSYEVGSQNWTRGFEKAFRERNGYDLVPYLAILSGRVVDSVAASEKVLADFRKTIADLFVENYAARLAARCHEHDLDLGVECYGNGPFDTLKYGAKVDMPMGEFWASRDPGVKNTTGVGGEANAKLMSSISHVWGKRLTGMESYTAFPQDGKWQKDPYSLKAQGDRVFARGVNRLVYHRYAHQPWTDPTYVPGMTMGLWGTHFERTCTWWEIAAKPFLTYQARVQYLLQEGESVADVLVPVTSSVPNGGGDAESTFRGWAEPPTGYDWDWCSEDDATRFAARYRIVGRTAAEIASRIAAAGLLPDFICRTASATNALAWCHRRYATGDEAYFVAWGDAQRGTEATCSFRQRGRFVELWDAESGDIVRAARMREADGRTEVTLRLKPSGSVFVFFRAASTAPVEALEEPSLDVEAAGPWQLDIAGKSVVLEQLRDWTSFADPDIRYFSGTASYRFDLAKAGLSCGCLMDFGEVKNAAEVLVDGKKVATLWRPPFRCRLPTGTNLTVRVVNLWPNRLIGDEELPENCTYGKAFLPGWGVGIREIPDWVREGRPIPNGRHTFTTWKHWQKGDRLLPSGLLGPVRVAVGSADATLAPADDAVFSDEFKGRDGKPIAVPEAPAKYRRPEGWKSSAPCPKTLKEIARDHSSEMRTRAKAQMEKVNAVNRAGRYKATGRGMDAHACPEWFVDAKLGMFVDWGLYSIAAYSPYLKGARLYPDWYEYKSRPEYRGADGVWAYHRKNWGEDFKPDHFIALFKGEKFDAPQLMKVFRRCGAKYVVPFLKHHSGFCEWDCSYTFRDTVDGPAERDFTREMADACRAEGLKFGVYNSQADEWEYPILQDDGSIKFKLWGGKIVDYAPEMEFKASGKVAVKDFVYEYIVPQMTEFIDKYDPDLLWYDADWSTRASENGSYDITAYLYNRADGRKEVCCNDRYGRLDPAEEAAFGRKGIKLIGCRTVRGDFFTDEWGDTAENIDPKKWHPWESCSGISKAYGNHWMEELDPSMVMSEREFVCHFADIVARGGNLLLLVNLDAQGALPDIQRTRLEQIGTWLSTYGEAIYATRPLAPYATETVSYTQSKDGNVRYAIVKKPASRLILDFEVGEGGRLVEMKSGRALRHVRRGKAVEVSVPADLLASTVPFVIRADASDACRR